MTQQTIKKPHGILKRKRKPGEKTLAEEWAEVKREEARPEDSDRQMGGRCAGRGKNAGRSNKKHAGRGKKKSRESRAEAERRDLKIINRHAEALTAEATNAPADQNRRWNR